MIAFGWCLFCWSWFPASSFVLYSIRRKREARLLLQESIGVGIDLGTTNSAIAVMKDHTPVIIAVENSRTIPSVVALVPSYDEDDPLLVSQENIRNVRPLVGKRAADTEEFVYRNVKRIIGTGGNSIPKDVRAVVPGLQRNSGGKTYQKNSLEHRLHDARYFPTRLRYGTDAFIAPETISACILRTLIAAVEEQEEGTKVDRAVIGIPAYFDDAQANATMAAGYAAGLTKVKLMREPEAAALAYAHADDEKVEDLDELVLAFDLGGGTYDVSVLHRVGGGVTEIICTAGDAQLGGSVWDAKLAGYLERKIGKAGQGNLVLAAEALRIYLSNHKSATMQLPTTYAGWDKLVSEQDWQKRIFRNKGNASVNDTDSMLLTITRSNMERVCEDEWLALLRPLREVAIMAGVLLAGDARPSAVAAALDLEEAMSQRFEDFYDEEGEYREDPQSEAELEQSLMRELDPVAAKKAQQKGRKRAREVAKKERRFQEEKRKAVQQATPAQVMASSGIKIRDGIPGRPISRIVLVGGATRMPAIGRLLTQLTGVIPEKTVNPDEAVALGCAVKAGMLDGSSSADQNMLLNPMQAAILKAMAIRDGKIDPDDGDDDDDDYEFL